MFYKCTSCGEEKHVDGCLPSASCGMLLFADLAIAFAFVFPFVDRLAMYAGWWAKLFLLPLGLLCFYLLVRIPEFFEWLWAMSKPCVRCRKRRWSWPFTRGFGL